jgi:hypothetical protein
MNFTITITADELAGVEISAHRPFPDLGGQQVHMADRKVYAYVTAESAARIAEAWQQVAAELAEREQAVA